MGNQTSRPPADIVPSVPVPRPSMRSLYVRVLLMLFGVALLCGSAYAYGYFTGMRDGAVRGIGYAIVNYRCLALAP
jgi:hypothetical protein